MNHQLGVFNFLINNLSVPSLALEIILFIAVRFCLSTKSHCKKFHRMHRAQTQFLVDMATSLRQQQVVSPGVSLTYGQNISSAPAGIPILLNDGTKRGLLILKLQD